MLKVAVILCLLAVCSNLRITKATNGTYTVENINREAYLVRQMAMIMKIRLRALLLDKAKYYSKSQITLTNMRTGTYELVDEKLLNALNKTRADVDARIAKGYDAEYCYRDVEADVFRIRETTFYELARCVDSNIDRYSADISCARHFLTEAKTATSMLNAVTISCYFDLFNEQECFKSTAKEAMVYVQRLKTKYNAIRANVPKTYKEVEGDALLCIGKTGDEIGKEIAQSVFFTESCIEGAE